MREKFYECFQHIRVLLYGLLCFVIPGIIGVCLHPTQGFSQQRNSATDTTAIDIAQLRFFAPLTDKAGLALLAKDAPDSELKDLDYNRNLIARYQSSMPGTFIEKSVVLAFTLTNSSDSIKEVCFIPGFFCRNLNIFKRSETNGHIIRIPDSISANEEYKGCRTIRLMPGEQVPYYARFNMLRTSSNSFSPRIIEKDYFNQWLRSRKEHDLSQDIVTYVASGVLLLMIFYSLAVYIQSRAKEFIFYSGYAFCTAVLLFLKSYLNLDHSAFNLFYEEYLDFMILCTGVFFYLVFVRKFLNTKEEHPFLHRLLRIADVILLILLGIFSVIYFFTNKYVILNVMENYVIKLFLFVIGIVFIVYAIKAKNTLLNFLAAGNIALVLFSILSLCIILFKWEIHSSNPGSVLNRSMFYYELGLVLELVFFLTGLAYKNRRDIIEQVKETERIKLENERQAFENRMAVMAAQQEERNRISADMHDELGSGVTAIRLMSEIVKSKMKERSLPEIEKISNSANELLNKMNTIIWTMKSSNDTVESLAAYIRAYAIEYFDSTPISCSVQVTILPNVEMSGEKRRNIFLSVKEALNNILKHANATHVLIDILAQTDKLKIVITDNGVGIDVDKLRRFGNGLSNMKKRMQSISGDFHIHADGGTVLQFEIPI